MKKRTKNINITKRNLYTIIAFLTVLLVGVSVYAFGTSTPSSFGHSAGELDLSEGVSGDAVFLGNVDVSGRVKIGDSVTCDANAEGSLRYNSTDKTVEICDAANWQNLCS